MRWNKNVFYLLGLFVLLFACRKNTKRAPLLEIVSPANNAEIFKGPGYAFTIQVNASDPDGLIKTVDIKVDNQLICQLLTVPYTCRWESIASPGNHTITAIATDNDGLSTSASIIITVKTEAPSVSTLPVSFVGTTYAICASNLSSMGIPRVSLRGICWNKTGSPTIADSTRIVKTDTGSFDTPLSGLQLGTTYYVKAFAQNSEGVLYGNEVSFTTASAYSTNTGSFVDARDQQSYKWVQIGNQVWMAENLRYNAPGSMYYPNTNDSSYGRLYRPYNFSVLAPAGWHVPSKDEWQELLNFVGGNGVAGGFLKEAGTSHWLSPNLGASNLANFNGLPAGFITTKYSITSSGLGSYCGIWASNQQAAILNFNSTAAHFGSPNVGWNLYSIRCIKN